MCAFACCFRRCIAVSRFAAAPVKGDSIAHDVSGCASCKDGGSRPRALLRCSGRRRVKTSESAVLVVAAGRMRWREKVKNTATVTVKAVTAVFTRTVEEPLWAAWLLVLAFAGWPA